MIKDLKDKKTNDHIDYLINLITRLIEIKQK